MKIKANGILMSYETHGNGENLIMIHGAGGNLNMWYHQLPVFSKSYHVITYDVRGAGETENPDMGYSIPLFLEDIYELMKVLGITETHILGYSMGGRIAVETAIKYPQMVKSLVLSNSILHPSRPTRESVEGWRTQLDLLDKGDIKTAAERIAVGAFSSAFVTENPAEIERYRNVAMRNKPAGLARIMRALVTPAPLPDLSKIKCPVLLIMGTNDPNLAVEQGKKAQQDIEGSRLVILPTGHAAPIELPDRFNSAVMEFLSSIK